MSALDYVEANGRRLAVRCRSGSSPTLVFFPGYASDMDGAKAVAIDAFAAQRGLAMLRFDYSGTGLSDGEFLDGTLDRWIEDSLAVIAGHASGPLLLIGSSMGGWIALHVALALGARVRALVGIAAAPDFTEWGFTDLQKAQLESHDRIEEPNTFGPEPQIFTRAFWQSGQARRLLDSDIAIDCPVRLVHGDRDEDVPVGIAARLAARLRSDDVQTTIIKGGGHRLSEPNELAAIVRVIEALVETNA